MSRFLQMLWYYLKVTTDTILVSVSTPVVRISQVRYQSKANEFLFPAILRHVTIYRIPGVFIDNQSWRVFFWTPDSIDMRFFFLQIVGTKSGMLFHVWYMKIPWKFWKFEWFENVVIPTKSILFQILNFHEVMTSKFTKIESISSKSGNKA